MTSLGNGYSNEVIHEGEISHRENWELKRKMVEFESSE